ncbi:lactonase family protein [Streptomyces bohaiensis]|uniref:Lactonase family protein n=1 Tax=Streptomyces bohaiensis TaxID=1431344 RepID=A0ABX1CF81_9ACTN|nr:lactonase family protein [Streptomyces bohaiensis]NJQ17708.1 lactonase family protein [Streptomyces bohaiensis]
MTSGAHRAYIGSFTSQGGRGVTVAAVDPSDGALTRLSDLRPLDNPSYLVLSADGGTLYAAGETDAGALAALSLADPDRPWLLAPPTAAGGAGSTHLAVAPRRAYLANYTSGSVSSLPLAEDGAPHGDPVVTPHRGSGPVTERQSEPHAHGVAVSADGRWLLCADLGTDSVLVYALDPADGSQRPHGALRLPAGDGPRHLVVHPDGVTVHVVSELDPQVTTCRFDTAAGSLEITARTELPGRTASDDPDYPSGLGVTADGRWLYVAVRGADEVAVLSLDGTDGPRVRSSVGCGGHWPRDLTVSDDGRRLYVANERSGDVSWFALNPQSGLPALAGRLELPAPSCVVLRG